MVGHLSNVIGIDLGTTYSVVAHVDSHGRPISIPNASGEITTPSVVLFDEDGPVVGREAALAAPMHPEHVADCVKRDMGNRNYRKQIRGGWLPPEVISSLILRRLKADAERKLGPISAGVVTVPAYFDEPRRKATIDAGRLAELEVLQIINEPTAAAIAFGYQSGYLDPNDSLKPPHPTKVLVYDLGGGTFDVTVVEMDGNDFRAIATDGDVRLGGRDWDDRLSDIVAERFRHQHREDPRENPASLYELQTAVEIAKRTLSELKKASVYVNHLGTRMKVDVSREEFEEATSTLLERTRTTAEIVVLQAGLAWGDIDKVLLVGGATRMPMVGRMLEDLTGKQPDRSASPDEVVAHGAALYAELIARQRGLTEGRTTFTLHDINSHSLGIVGFDKRTQQRLNSIIIPKNSTLPCAVTKRFVTAKRNQRSVAIQVLEGESEVPDACTQVGICTIRDLPSDLPGGWPILVRYEYDANGQLRVIAKLKGHEASVHADFVRNSSLSDDDLLLWGQRLKAQAEKMD